MGTNFFAQRSGCAILHPPYEHEYASGEENAITAANIVRQPQRPRSTLAAPRSPVERL